MPEPERLKFYMDEHVPTAVTRGLQRRGVNVLTVQDQGTLAASDEHHLALAAEQGRVLFTQDADFLRLHAAGMRHTGIIYAHQQTPIGTIIPVEKIIWLSRYIVYTVPELPYPLQM